MRIIDKTGPLGNPADRDHCIQYMVAVPLIFGRLTAADYEDEVAVDPRIDRLRALMQVRENPEFTRDYYDPQRRFIGNAVQVFFTDGSATPRAQVELPGRAPSAPGGGRAADGRKVRGGGAGAFPGEAGGAGGGTVHAIRRVCAPRASTSSWPNWSAMADERAALLAGARELGGRAERCGSGAAAAAAR